MPFQGLSEAAGAPVRISFTPTLMPMSRGMQSTIYVRLTEGTSVDDLREHLQASLQTFSAECKDEMQVSELLSQALSNCPFGDRQCQAGDFVVSIIAIWGFG
jgi:hypothetical protein